MMPTLGPGTIIFGVRSSRVRAGDVVIIRHGHLDKIKRVQAIQASKVFVIGDNGNRSTDGRDFGWLDIDVVIARVVWPKRARS